MHSPVLLVPAGLVDELEGVGEAFVGAEGGLALVLGIGALLAAFDGLAVDADVGEESLVVVVGVEADAAGRCQCGGDHRPLDELEVAGGVVPLDGEDFLEVANLELEMLQAGVADDGVLELEHAVGHVAVYFAVPALVDLGLDGKAGAADAEAVGDAVGPVLLAEEDGAVGLYAVVKPDLVAGVVLGTEDEDSVLGLGVEGIDFDLHAVLVVLLLLFLCVGCHEGKRQGCEGK